MTAPRRWWLPRLGGAYLVTRAGDRPSLKGWRSVPALFVRSAVEGALASGSSLVYDLYRELGGTRQAGLSRAAHAEHHREVVRRLDQAFRSGLLVAYGRPPPVISQIPVDSGPPPAPFPEDPIEEEQETYINIRLVGEDGAGVPGVRYRILLPDSSVREGNLDGSGSATLRGKFSGNCKVAFPELDASAWEPL